MLCCGDPLVHGGRELVGGHARMRGGHYRKHALFTAPGNAGHVAFEQRRKRLLRFPFRMLRRERLHAIEGEDQLERHRLLRPERAVVVERGNPFRRRDKVRPALTRDPADEVDERFLRRAVVP